MTDGVCRHLLSSSGERAGVGRRPWTAPVALFVVLTLVTLTPARSAAQFCLRQSDCEDGLFCTDDNCVLGLCVRLPHNCADLNIQCTADSCRENERRCVHNVLVGDHCEDFNPFTVDDHCNERGECVGSDVPLSCDNNDDCQAGFVCIDGVCTEHRTPTKPPTILIFTDTPTRPPTRTPVHTRTRTPTRTRTVTATPRPIASATATQLAGVPTPTPSPPPPACPGDCDGNAVVAVNELVLGVSIASGRLALDACPAFDTNGDGSVDISELITAVRAALVGCDSLA